MSGKRHNRPAQRKVHNHPKRYPRSFLQVGLTSCCSTATQWPFISHSPLFAERRVSLVCIPCDIILTLERVLLAAQV